MLRRMIAISAIGLALAFLLIWASFSEPSAHAAQLAPTPPPAALAPAFHLPFNTPPGPSTWYITQFYGNTPLAYDHRADWYDQGQGLHFGVDFGARCGTPVVSIGDGRVIEVDNLSHGAGPHNLSILHPEGYVSFYGHLLEHPKLRVADEVKQGQSVALTGDPDLTCHSRPHLHLEIRDKTMGRAYNPLTLIDADWDSLALFGPYEEFARDLDHPRRWVSPFDQPMVDFGGDLLNNYPHSWPPRDW